MVYSHLTANRKLNFKEKSLVQDLLDVRGNKKIIQEKILGCTGKTTTLKDLSNIAYSMKNSSNDLCTMVKDLRDNYSKYLPT